VCDQGFHLLAVHRICYKSQTSDRVHTGGRAARVWRQLHQFEPDLFFTMLSCWLFTVQVLSSLFTVQVMSYLFTVQRINIVLKHFWNNFILEIKGR
jgi:hypothetical protein